MTAKDRLVKEILAFIGEVKEAEELFTGKHWQKEIQKDMTLEV